MQNRFPTGYRETTPRRESPLVRAAFLVAISSFPVVASEIPWPAEPIDVAVNLTPIEGPGANDFYYDLSGAFWNPVTRRLWLCRNGPGDAASKIWAVREDGQGSFIIDTRNGNRGEWTGFGDLEDLTQANLNEDTIYGIVEGEERIKELDVSTYGVAVLRNDWDISPFTPPYDGYSGSEGIAFIPDACLAAGGFVDPSGNPRISQNGMGGLMFVAHQNGGRIYVFDLDRSDSSYTYIGSYKTNFTESCALAFDRTCGYLYILHGANFNRIEVTNLGSTQVGSERQLNEVITYATPTNSPPNANMEGIALMSEADCDTGVRSFFLTIDDGGPNSLYWFRRFPCVWFGDLDGNGVVDGRDIAVFTSQLLDRTGSHGDHGAGPIPDVHIYLSNLQQLIYGLLAS